MQALKNFCTRPRLGKFDCKRNDITYPQAISDMSPYLHYGHIAPQRAILKVKKFKKIFPKGVDSFVEECVVRRELSDNFCFYNPHYDRVTGTSAWAQKSLALHAADERAYLYTRGQLDESRTHDDLWNAAQRQLVTTGKMHGFLRM